MKKTGFYIIRDKFFDDMSDPYLKGNKAGNRPHYYCFEDTSTGIYWMIPLSSRIDKYKRIMEKKEKAGKGLLSQMLSLPEKWNYTLSGLCAINPESKDAIRSALRELEEQGYVVRCQTTDASGKFSKNEYIIYEVPVSKPDTGADPSPEKPLSENPTTDNPPTGKTSAENPTQLNTKKSNTQEQPVL